MEKGTVSYMPIVVPSGPVSYAVLQYAQAPITRVQDSPNR